MYNTFYGFKEPPFNPTPDNKFFFPSEKHEEALHSLMYTIKERKGFAVITGEIGAGKTTVWHALLNRLEPGTKLALITNTHLTSKQMLMAILEDLGVPYKDKWTKVRLLSSLNKYLIEQASLGFNVVLVIDEAQNLKIEVLEEIRMLSNLETDKEKLIQILLIGQPQLNHLLDSKELIQLKQRVVVYYHIHPLDKKETEKYIEHRLRIAGFNNGQESSSPLFTSLAIDKIYSFSRGIPRLINSICDRALLTGFVREKKEISSQIIEEVTQELKICGSEEEKERGNEKTV